jgi:DNA-binding response OmpR family regulator
VSLGHTALVVEDDTGIAEGLVEILKGAGCDSIVTDNKQEALELLRTNPPCIVLLDLQIKEEADAIKGHIAHGTALLKAIRQLYPEHPGQSWWLPIVVISGFASETDEAVQVMRDGATTLIQKPFKMREVTDTLLEELQRSGRAKHGSCLCGPTSVKTTDGQLLLRFLGDHDGHRTKLTIGNTVLHLANSELKLLLHLALAHQTGIPIHKFALGAKKDESGYKSVSRLRNELKSAMPGGPELITNDHHGHYGLAPTVIVAACDALNLEKIGDATITDLAAKVAASIRTRSADAD